MSRDPFVIPAGVIKDDPGYEQAVVDELVEVVGGQGSADADGGGRVVAAHGDAALGHVAVQGPAEWVPQPGEGGELLIEVVVAQSGSSQMRV